MPLTHIPLLANLAILTPVCVGLARDAGWVRAAYGPKQPGRQILLAIYGAIFILSLYLLVRPNQDMTLGLLTVQIIYKLLSPITVGGVRNPVVLSNLLIAVTYGGIVAFTALGSS